MFTHLHNHTKYSKLDGAITASLLFPVLKDLGQEAFAKTDHGTIAGIMEFADEGTKAGVKVIAGIELYEVLDIGEKFIGESFCNDKQKQDQKKITDKDVTPEGTTDKKRRYWHLTLWAKDAIGYKQLVQLCTAANSKDAFFFKPRVDSKMMKEIIKGGHIIMGTGCPISRFAQEALAGAILDSPLDHYRNIFGDNIFVEIMANSYDDQKQINDTLIDFANKKGLPIIVTNDCHYLTREHARLQDILVCIATGQFVDGERRFKFEGDSYYLRNEDELKNAFQSQYGITLKDEWLSNTQRIVDQCEHASYVKESEFRLPVVQLDKQRNLDEFKKWIEQHKAALIENMGVPADLVGKALEL